KDEFQRALHLTHVGRRRGVGAKIRRGKIVGKAAEIRVVKYVIDLPSELQALAFRNLSVLQNGEVKILDSIQSQTIPSVAAEVPQQRLSQRETKCVVPRTRHRSSSTGLHTPMAGVAKGPKRRFTTGIEGDRAKVTRVPIGANVDAAVACVIADQGRIKNSIPQ